MQIEINDQKKIFAVQQEFNQAFPNLRIEFYQRPDRPAGAPARQLMKSRGKTIQDCRETHDAGLVLILPASTYGELKQHLSEVYGLTIQLSRNTDTDSPPGTPLSESGTLEELNNPEIPPHHPAKADAQTFWRGDLEQ